MEKEKLIITLKSINFLETTLLNRKSCLEEDIEELRSKMEGKTICYEKLNVIESNYSNDKWETYVDRIIAKETEIKNITNTLKEIDAIRDAIYALPIDEQKIIISYYINGESSTSIAYNMFFSRRTINRKLNMALNHLLETLKCPQCPQCHIA